MFDFLFIILIFIFAFSIGCISNQQDKKHILMTKQENILTNILNISQPLTVSGIEEVIGLKLTQNHNAHNTFDVYEGNCTNPECDFINAEFRKPPKNSTVTDGILILSINTNKHIFTKKPMNCLIISGRMLIH